MVKRFSVHEKFPCQYVSMSDPTQLGDVPQNISVGKKLVYNNFIQKPKTDLKRKIRYWSQF